MELKKKNDLENNIDLSDESNTENDQKKSNDLIENIVST